MDSTSSQGIRDLSDSDSSASPPIAQTTWPQTMGTDTTALSFGSMMYPFSSSSTSTTPLHSTSSVSAAMGNPFDFTTSQQYLYQNMSAAAGYTNWAYGTYGFPTAAAAYQGVYGQDFKDFKDFKDVALTATAGSSTASTPIGPTVPLPWTVTHEGKKKRQPYKKDQISRLEYEFTCNPYLTNKRRAELSTQLMLDEKQIKVWFQNRRMKDKKLRQRVAGPYPIGTPVTPCMERLIN